MIHLILAVIYLSFVSMGLPDALLGAAWPSIYPEFHVPVSYAGIISAIIAAGTVAASLMSDRLTRTLGSGKVTALSVATTAVALFAFSVSDSFWQLCLWAIPYGLGAGSIDASLNNYVALHYASHHMSWLHCMWGLGASVGPYIMGVALSGGHPWNMGYRYIALLQTALTLLLFCTLPFWKRQLSDSQSDSARALSLREIVSIPGVRYVLLMFFAYCGMETTAGLWASSYLVLWCNLSAETAASYAGLFYLGLTAGRALSGFITFRLNDMQMIRMGQGICLAGIVILLLPLGTDASLPGLVITGLGCAPIYPSVIHSTPIHFGAKHSQAIIGVQMASAYVGTCLMPPVFGLIAQYVSPSLLPVFLMMLLFLTFFMHCRLLKTKQVYTP